MAEREPMPVILCWHMHQPEYRDLRNGHYQFPWTYLHALKDYVDMAAHLEAEPAARAVVNFAPVLLEQIADYAEQLGAHLASGAPVSDPLLAALAEPALPVGVEERAHLVKQCLRVNRQRVIDRFAAFGRLAAIADWVVANPDALRYVDNQFLADLLVWYHLGWIAETERRRDARVQRLQDKAHGFSVHDRRELLDVLRGMLASVLPRYRALAEAGRVELAMSPHAHPILPLLLDLRAGQQTEPEAPQPEVDEYPGGAERARWHLRHGREAFRRHLGVEAHGCWPSEGALSVPALAAIADEGFQWVASGGSVLANSRGTDEPQHGAHGPCRHRVYRVADIGVDCFFRDDGLSDLIGFTYSGWHADDAVANFVHHLENIAAGCASPGECAISIVLDGENAWEYYPENGFHFLEALYRRLARHEQLRLDTFSGFRARCGARAQLPGLKAGSWVYGTLSTWIGSPDKNRGWEMLVDAKRAYDEAVAAGRLAPELRERATQQLAVCEGSDWFWWFGDYNPGQSVSDFERLYRLHLGNLYRLLGVEPPGYLSDVFTRGGGDPALGGVMRSAAAPGGAA
ncbi:MAG: hypothetical protein CALGDGBN_00426 [Pseudomonadales bacterium]|nr:hypothetical protein [Pseudomonadales bacterium]